MLTNHRSQEFCQDLAGELSAPLLHSGIVAPWHGGSEAFNWPLGWAGDFKDVTHIISS